MIHLYLVDISCHDSLDTYAKTSRPSLICLLLKYSIGIIVFEGGSVVSFVPPVVQEKCYVFLI